MQIFRLICLCLLILTSFSEKYQTKSLVDRYLNLVNYVGRIDNNGYQNNNFNEDMRALTKNSQKYAEKLSDKSERSRDLTSDNHQIGGKVIKTQYNTENSKSMSTEYYDYHKSHNSPNTILINKGTLENTLRDIVKRGKKIRNNKKIIYHHKGHKGSKINVYSGHVNDDKKGSYYNSDKYVKYYSDDSSDQSYDYRDERSDQNDDFSDDYRDEKSDQNDDYSNDYKDESRDQNDDYSDDYRDKSRDQNDDYIDDYGDKSKNQKDDYSDEYRDKSKHHKDDYSDEYRDKSKHQKDDYSDEYRDKSKHQKDDYSDDYHSHKYVKYHTEEDDYNSYSDYQSVKKSPHKNLKPRKKVISTKKEKTKSRMCILNAKSEFCIGQEDGTKNKKYKPTSKKNSVVATVAPTKNTRKKDKSKYKKELKNLF